MKAHTPEPIRCDDHGKIFYANGGCDAFVTDVHFARRIVACVNACAGIPTGDLENLSVSAYWQGVLLKNQKLEEHRDELLADMENKADIATLALRKAWQLGQTYWQQADSESMSQWKKADATQAKFQQLVEETHAAIASTKGGA